MNFLHNPDLTAFVEAIERVVPREGPCAFMRCHGTPPDPYEFGYAKPYGRHLRSNPIRHVMSKASAVFSFVDNTFHMWHGDPIIWSGSGHAMMEQHALLSDLETYRDVLTPLLIEAFSVYPDMPQALKLHPACNTITYYWKNSLGGVSDQSTPLHNPHMLTPP